MSLVSLANSRWGPAAGMSLVRILRPRLARRLAGWVATRAARQESSGAVQALRGNLSIVLNLPPTHPQVQAAVETVFRRATRSFVSLFESMGRGFDGLRQTSGFDPRLMEIAQARLEQGGGMLYVGCHTVGFDHLMLLMSSLEYPIQVLAYPETEGSYSVLNRIRREFGADLAPIDYHTLRRAIKYLRRGGIVLTGVDRPDPRGEWLEFFGRKAKLPTGHARLALRTGAPIMVGASSEEPSGRYSGKVLALVESSEYAGRPDAELALAQRVISEFESFIREHTDQWMMFYPVWPDDEGVNKVGHGQ